MARPEKQLDTTNSALARFAEGLRELRRSASGMTYRAMAEKANYSPTVLSEAAAGRKLPTLEVTRAYVSACGGDVNEWSTRWEAVAAELDSTGTREPDSDTAKEDPAKEDTAKEDTAPEDTAPDDAAAEPDDSAVAGAKPTRSRRRDLLLVLATVVVMVGIAAIVVTVLLNRDEGSGPLPRGAPADGGPPAGAACSALPAARACFDGVRGVFWVKDLPPGDRDHTAVYWASTDGRLRGECHNLLTSTGPWVTCPHPSGLRPRAPVTFQAAVVDDDQVRERGPTVDEAR